jgi:hypothetical protein
MCQYCSVQIHLSACVSTDKERFFKFRVFIITDKVRVKGERKVRLVGVIKDKELNLEEIEVSHTLGGAA